MKNKIVSFSKKYLLQSDIMRAILVALCTISLVCGGAKAEVQFFWAFVIALVCYVGMLVEHGIKEANCVPPVPPKPTTTTKVKDCKAKGMTQRETVKEVGVSLSTVRRHWNR